MEDGTLAACVPDCPGLLAFGADPHECARELYVRLEDWVKVSLRNGNPLPIIAGIDLNGEASHILASYHDLLGREEPSGEFYEDETELASALEARTKGV